MPTEPEDSVYPYSYEHSGQTYTVKGLCAGREIIVITGQFRSNARGGPWCYSCKHNQASYLGQCRPCGGRWEAEYEENHDHYNHEY